MYISSTFFVMTYQVRAPWYRIYTQMKRTSIKRTRQILSIKNIKENQIIHHFFDYIRMTIHNHSIYYPSIGQSVSFNHAINLIHFQLRVRLIQNVPSIPLNQIP